MAGVGNPAIILPETKESYVGDLEKKNELRKFITDNFFFGVDSIQYEDTDSLMAKGIVDSTGILELIAFIEEAYGFAVEDDEIIPENLDSIFSILSFINKKTA